MQNIFLIGPMGAGKTTIGKLLAGKLGFKFSDSDAMIEQRCGVDIKTIFDIEGENGFRVREEKMIEELTGLSSSVLSTGGGAILNKQSRQILGTRGIVIYLNIDPHEQYLRIKGDRSRPLLQGASPLDKLTELFNIRHPLYVETCDYICYPTGIGPLKIASELALLQQTLQSSLNSYIYPSWLQVK